MQQESEAKPAHWSQAEMGARERIKREEQLEAEAERLKIEQGRRGEEGGGERRGEKGLEGERPRMGERPVGENLTF
jgi:hypothetical protein